MHQLQYIYMSYPCVCDYLLLPCTRFLIAGFLASAMFQDSIDVVYLIFVAYTTVNMF